MRLPADYHMHTPLCHHATGEPSEYAGRGLAAGLTEIGFSDHSPMPKDGFDKWRMELSRLGDYIEAVERARDLHPQLTIKIALEVDYIPGKEDWIRQLRGMHSWDYFIGSVHYVDDAWALDNPDMLEEYDKRGVFEVWCAYFERLTMAAESGLFQTIGHPDLCKKFGHRPSRDVTPLYRKFLQAAARSGTAIELNTGGLRKPCKEVYPSEPLLRIAKQEGVPITFGSDAHAPGEVGANFSESVELARQAGYTHALRFDLGRARAEAI